MKTRPLPEIDLARIAPLLRDQQYRELKRIKLGHPPHTYAPTRNNELDTLNIEPGPFGTGARTPWSVIKANIINQGKSPEEINENLRVSEALYDFAEAHKLFGRRRDDILPLSMGISEKVVYWLPAVVAVSGIPTMLFVDPRRTMNFTARGRQFGFSVMHERKAAYPDLNHVRLGIIQFTNSAGSARSARLYTDEGVDLLNFETLDRMVQETYALWREVLEEREEEMRRRASGIKGSLL